MKAVDDFWTDICEEVEQKRNQGCTWQEIAEEINSKHNVNFNESFYRKRAKRVDALDGISQDIILEANKIRAKAREERIQTNANIRLLSREETIKEIALECANVMSDKKMLQIPKREEPKNKDEKYALFNVADLHYGMYDTAIAKKRIGQATRDVEAYCRRNGVTNIIINGLGDFISGNIHLPLRINNREDVITQVIEVSEIMAEIIAELSKNFYVQYYMVYGNHGRVIPNKKESINLENLERIIEWYLATRLKDNPYVMIHTSEDFISDMIEYTVGKWRVGLVHGDKDKMSKVVSNVTLMTGKKFDLILTAHNHHFGADETNGCLVVANPSLIGADDYSRDLRLFARPAQTLIIVGDKSPIECLYYIALD